MKVFINEVQHISENPEEYWSVVVDPMSFYLDKRYV